MLKNIIKKLNNFKFSALVMSIVALVGSVYSLTSFFLYHFAGDIMETGATVDLMRKVGFFDRPFMGMFLYFMAVISLFIGIFLIYSFLPFIQNKEKVIIRKGLVLAGFVNAFFEFLLCVFMLLLVILENPKTELAIILTLPIGVLASIAYGLFLIPYLKCDFYMPEIKK